MEIFVKRASLEDAKNVAYLFNDYRVFYKQKSDITVALEFISERLDKNESVIFFAHDAKGVLLGFTQLYPNFSSVSDIISIKRPPVKIVPFFFTSSCSCLYLLAAAVMALRTFCFFLYLDKFVDPFFQGHRVNHL